jgi:hypothetical protein
MGEELMGDTGDTRATVVVVVDDGSELVLAHLKARGPDLALVDALARLQLAARRRGLRLRLRGASEELRALLELVGLADVLALEAPREPELGEQLGVEEVVQPGDPPA